MVGMVNHLVGHATVYAYILARDETGLVGAQEQHHVCNVHGVTNAFYRVLLCIRAIVCARCGVNPSWRDGIYSSLACQAHGKGVRKRSYSAFGSCVALGLGLAHAVTR